MIIFFIYIPNYFTLPTAVTFVTLVAFSVVTCPPVTALPLMVSVPVPVVAYEVAFFVSETLVAVNVPFALNVPPLVAPADAP